jgi:hypothetical protein
MAQVNSENSRLAPPCELALHERLKAAGMRLQRVSNDRYEIVWRHQRVCSGLTLLGAAKFIDRALNRGPSEPTHVC